MHPLDPFTNKDRIMMTENKPLEYAVLSWPVYQKLEKQVARTAITNQTTDIQAAYQLGVQSVLEALRNGFVVNR